MTSGELELCNIRITYSRPSMYRLKSIVYFIFSLNMSFIKFSLDREKSLKNAKLTEKSGGLSNCTVQKKDSLNARCDALHICILCIVYEYEHVLHIFK